MKNTIKMLTMVAILTFTAITFTSCNRDPEYLMAVYYPENDTDEPNYWARYDSCEEMEQAINQIWAEDTDNKIVYIGVYTDDISCEIPKTRELSYNIRFEIVMN